MTVLPLYPTKKLPESFEVVKLRKYAEIRNQQDPGKSKDVLTDLKRVDLLERVSSSIHSANTPSRSPHDGDSSFCPEGSDSTGKELISTNPPHSSPFTATIPKTSPLDPEPGINNETDDIVSVPECPIFYPAQGTSYFPSWPPSFNPSIPSTGPT